MSYTLLKSAVSRSYRSSRGCSLRMNAIPKQQQRQVANTIKVFSSTAAPMLSDIVNDHRTEATFHVLPRLVDCMTTFNTIENMTDATRSGGTVSTLSAAALHELGVPTAANIEDDDDGG
ncbi:hypothetical protein IV203_017943 [Nitzschia inconspicua]|uniref:Uncharacterized protein n=1 Tax=Nitzschia inconspicua TaxID=303405 RepID=A0A9K3Q5Y3_9STRA|nr:hypothetical protein IV203_017943 [Nitzschia inconspicua]